jgi:hypothetical protein
MKRWLPLLLLALVGLWAAGLVTARMLFRQPSTASVARSLFVGAAVAFGIFLVVSWVIATAGQRAGVAGSDDRSARPGNDPARFHGWLSSFAVAATCILVAGLAFVLSAASFGALSLPIVLVGLILGWFGKSRWVRWPAFSAAAAVLVMYLVSIVTGR